MNPEQIVREFCQAWERRDVDEILGYFAEDAVYHNMPMDPAKGHDAIRGVLQLFVPTSQRIEFELLAIAASGSTVHTERVDRFWMGERTIELPVAGVFEVSGDKITAWRDYFDLGSWMRQAGMQS